MREAVNADASAALAAAMLSGSWRGSPAPLALSADALARVAALLIRGGAAGLAGRRIAAMPLASTPAGARLQQPYRVIPRVSHSGKTTLVAALVRAGATYYSDEYAVFDAQGSVHPYARPLGIRDGNGDRPRRCPVQELGGTP